VRVILSTGLAPTLTPWTWVPSVAALLVYFGTALQSAHATSHAPHAADASRMRWALAVAWVAHGTALLAHLLGVGEAEPGARFGFAPALSATAWLVVAVYAIESRFVPLPGVRRALAVMGGITVGLVLIFPGEPHLHPTAPWAPLHWLVGIASYGLFGAAVLHAHLLNRAEQAMRPGNGKPARSGGLPLLKLEALTFRFVSAGFLALTVAIVLGALVSGPWRWDHKTVFSLLAWAVFAGLLLGRRAFGWRGRQATRWLYAGSLLLLLAYVGSRFVFEVLLQRTPA
jgi:ABC-type uncharacterized transport system permease subunit